MEKLMEAYEQCWKNEVTPLLIDCTTPDDADRQGCARAARPPPTPRGLRTSRRGRLAMAALGSRAPPAPRRSVLAARDLLLVLERCVH